MYAYIYIYIYINRSWPPGPQGALNNHTFIRFGNRVKSFCTGALPSNAVTKNVAVSSRALALNRDAVAKW